jgi:D-glycero-alpha-D-manno-heptose-7-phosphate kinase
MVITRTPCRISFFGGGTDYPVYYNQYGGIVLSTTINKYCYITCRDLPPFFDHVFRIRYGRQELTQTVEEIRHRSVRECLNFLNITTGIELVHTADIPAMSGIGSSSSFTVGLLNALYSLKGQRVTKRKLAFDAIEIEQQRIGEYVGSQDQIAAAFGGLNTIEFNGNNNIFVQPLTVQAEKLTLLQNKLLFYFTGFSRLANGIAEEQIRQTPNKLHELGLMKQMVTEAVSILNAPDSALNDFGRLLHESWRLKRGLTNRISNGQLDQIYDKARQAGALGGKICGAGGGGFLLLYVPEERQKRVKEVLKDLLLVPFRFENLGSHVIFYSS